MNMDEEAGGSESSSGQARARAMHVFTRWTRFPLVLMARAAPSQSGIDAPSLTSNEVKGRETTVAIHTRITTNSRLKCCLALLAFSSLFVPTTISGGSRGGPSAGNFRYGPMSSISCSFSPASPRLVSELAATLSFILLTDKVTGNRWQACFPKQLAKTFSIISLRKRSFWKRTFCLRGEANIN